MSAFVARRVIRTNGVSPNCMPRIQPRPHPTTEKTRREQARKIECGMLGMNRTPITVTMPPETPTE